MLRTLVAYILCSVSIILQKLENKTQNKENSSTVMRPDLVFNETSYWYIAHDFREHR